MPKFDVIFTWNLKLNILSYVSQNWKKVYKDKSAINIKKPFFYFPQKYIEFVLLIYEFDIKLGLEKIWSV
jgi:hypothetical protein